MIKNSIFNFSIWKLEFIGFFITYPTPNKPIVAGKIAKKMPTIKFPNKGTNKLTRIKLEIDNGTSPLNKQNRFFINSE